MKTFSILESYKVGWEKLKSGWQFVLVGAFAFLITSSISDQVDKLAGDASFIVTLPLFFVSMWLTVNFIKGILNIYDGHNVAPAKMFEWNNQSVNQTLKYFGLSVIIGSIALFFAVPIAVLLVSALDGTQGLQWYDIATGVAILLAGAYVGTRLIFAQYVMMDENRGVFESVKHSWDMTSGHVFKIMMFYVVSVLIGFVGFILLVIPGLIFCAIFGFANIALYRKIKHSHAHN